MHALATVAIPSHPLALMLSSSSLSIDNVGFRLPLQPLLSRAQELIAVVVVVVVFLTHPPTHPRRHYHPHLLPPSPSAPASVPAPAPTPAADDPRFDPDHPFGFGDDWAIRVLHDSFNELSNYFVRLGKPPVNQPVVQNVADYVYALIRVAEVVRELP